MLKSALKEAGLRDPEREATYALERAKTNYASTNFEKWFKRILFEWTTGYGLYYLSPLKILIILFVAFSFVYTYPITGVENKGVFPVWQKDRVDADMVENVHERLVETGHVGMLFISV